MERSGSRKSRPRLNPFFWRQKKDSIFSGFGCCRLDASCGCCCYLERLPLVVIYDDPTLPYLLFFHPATVYFTPSPTLPSATVGYRQLPSATVRLYRPATVGYRRAVQERSLSLTKLLVPSTVLQFYRLPSPCNRFIVWPRAWLHRSELLDSLSPPLTSISAALVDLRGRGYTTRSKSSNGASLRPRCPNTRTRSPGARSLPSAGTCKKSRALQMVTTPTWPSPREPPAAGRPEKSRVRTGGLSYIRNQRQSSRGSV